jgi:regulator of PEP synthase PpsR (kinase-PPPase family)
MNEGVFHLHLVSDATGETIAAVARACLAQFEGVNAQTHVWSLIRNQRQFDIMAQGLQQWPGLVLYTFVDEELRRALEEFCNAQGIACISVLDPVLEGMAVHFNRPFGHTPGKQHRLDAGYFARIAAMDYAIAHDDGHGAERLEQADVVILGVSRTSKTPTCLYLAGRSVKAANIPIILGQPLGLDPAMLRKPLVVGLTRDPDALIATRRNRLQFLQAGNFQADSESDYVDPDKVRDEIKEARRLFARLDCAVIDVTRRSIEETAAEIMMLLTQRQAERERQHA